MSVVVWVGRTQRCACACGGVCVDPRVALEGEVGPASGPRFCMNVYFKVTRAVFRKLPNINSILGKFLYYIRKVTTATYKLLSILEIEGDICNYSLQFIITVVSNWRLILTILTKYSFLIKMRNICNWNVTFFYFFIIPKFHHFGKLLI